MRSQMRQRRAFSTRGRFRAVNTRGSSADVPTELDDATRAAGVLGLAGLVTAAGNMIFHLLVARQGGVVRYGATAALLSFGTVAAASAAGLQYAIARRC